MNQEDCFVLEKGSAFHVSSPPVLQHRRPTALCAELTEGSAAVVPS